MRPRPVVLCAGIAVQDIVMRVDRFPQPGEKTSASDLVTIGGGCAANAAVAIARLGGRVRFTGPLGSAGDPASRAIVGGLNKACVDIAGVKRVRGAHASVSLILIDSGGEKMIATRRGKGLDKIRPHNPATLLRGVDILLADNRFPNFVLPLAHAARKRGIPVVVDFDQAGALDAPLLVAGTYVIVSSEALQASTGQPSLPAALRRLGAAISGFVAVTGGPDGVYWLDGKTVRHMPAFRVKAVDTLGAGDTFHGAFTLAIAEGRDPRDALRFASAAAALKCTVFGGMAGAPTRAKVQRLIAANS